MGDQRFEDLSRAGAEAEDHKRGSFVLTRGVGHRALAFMGRRRQRMDASLGTKSSKAEPCTTGLGVPDRCYTSSHAYGEGVEGSAAHE